MIRRLVLFGFGALISIFFLSLGPENRLKETFYAYIDYFNINKRVIYHLYSGLKLFFLFHMGFLFSCNRAKIDKYKKESVSSILIPPMKCIVLNSAYAFHKLYELYQKHLDQF